MSNQTTIYRVSQGRPLIRPNFAPDRLPAEVALWHERAVNALKVATIDTDIADMKLETRTCNAIGRSLSKHNSAVIIALRATGDPFFLRRLLKVSSACRRSDPDSWHSKNKGQTLKRKSGNFSLAVHEGLAFETMSQLAYVLYVNNLAYDTPECHEAGVESEYWCADLQSWVSAMGTSKWWEIESWREYSHMVARKIRAAYAMSFFEESGNPELLRTFFQLRDKFRRKGPRNLGKKPNQYDGVDMLAYQRGWKGGTLVPKCDEPDVMQTVWLGTTYVNNIIDVMAHLHFEGEWHNNDNYFRKLAATISRLYLRETDNKQMSLRMVYGKHDRRDRNTQECMSEGKPTRLRAHQDRLIPEAAIFMIDDGHWSTKKMREDVIGPELVGSYEREWAIAQTTNDLRKRAVAADNAFQIAAWFAMAKAWSRRSPDDA